MVQVSVVIPTFNRGGFLQRAVESVLAQTYRQWEVIVVDDGSNDDTPLVLEHLEGQDDRIRFVRHTIRRGAQAARNTGIESARGEWIAFLESDDAFLPESIEVRLDLAKQQGLDVVHSECDVVRHPNPQQVRLGVPPLAGHVYPQLLASQGPVFPALMVKKKALEEIGLLDESIVSYQEWETSIRLARCFAFGFVPEPTFVYHCHAGETISKNRLGEARGYEQIVLKHRAEILRHTGPAVLARHFEQIGQFYHVAMNNRLARRYMAMAILNRPLSRRTGRRLGFLGRYLLGA